MTKSNLDLLSLTNHAYKRIIQRVISATKELLPEEDKFQFVETFIKTAIIEGGQYIGISSDQYGKRTHLFKVSKSAVGLGFDAHISLDYKVIVTVIVKELIYNQYAPLQQKINKIYQQEYRKVSKSEIKKSREAEMLRLNNEIQISMIRMKIYKAKSKKVIAKYEDQIKGLLMTEARERSGLKSIRRQLKDIERYIIV